MAPPPIIQYTNLLHRYLNRTAPEVTDFLASYRNDRVFLARARVVDQLYGLKEQMVTVPAPKTAHVIAAKVRSAPKTKRKAVASKATHSKFGRVHHHQSTTGKASTAAKTTAGSKRAKVAAVKAKRRTAKAAAGR
jgi:hypothetical protein